MTKSVLFEQEAVCRSGGKAEEEVKVGVTKGGCRTKERDPF
jgi:hypothetical protein